MRERPEVPLGLLIAMTALALRLAGIGFGLPGTYIPDEPHHINIAVYFSSGDLNPHVFKYPTLWMYALSILYGIVFLVWSAAGFLRSARDFSHLFIWDPTLFYLSARCLATACGTLGLYFIYKTGREFASGPVALIAAFFCAISPPLVYFGHMAKPDMLMFFFASVAWWFCARYYRSGEIRDCVLAGGALGLAISSQYTAALLSPLLLWSHILRGRRQGLPWKQSVVSRALLFGYVALPLAFLAGTPFALMDWKTFLMDMADQRSFAAGRLSSLSFHRTGLGIIGTYGELIGARSLGILFLVLGALRSLRIRREDGLFLLGPLVWGGLALGLQDRSTNWVNYVFSLFPGAALLMGTAGWELLRPRPHRRLLWLVFALCMGPALSRSLRVSGSFLHPDTRTQAKQWIEAHVPPGRVVLLDQVHAGPALVMARSQVVRLYEKTKALGHPRALYYARMLESHPGGGYEILRVQRTYLELITLKRHAAWSQQGYEWLDVEGGMPALKAAGVQYVVTSSVGATRENSPRLKGFFDDLENQGLLLKEFSPPPGIDAPLVRVYQIK
jgi:hypothetical protein